ncbi:MAG: hypothetical protein U0169_06365 [Polyangiaceae bacterium]
MPSFRDLLAERRYRELSTHVPEDRDDRHRVEAELSFAKRGSPVDAILAGRRAREAKWPDASRYVAGAVRAYAICGAKTLAREFFDASRAEGVLSAEDVALLDAQFASSVFEGETRAAHASFASASAATAETTVASRVKAVDDALADAAVVGSERRALVLVAAALARRERRFADAATRTFEAIKAAPSADDVLELRIDAVSDLLADGQFEAARDVLASARTECTDGGMRANRLDAHLRALDSGGAKLVVTSASTEGPERSPFAGGKGVVHTIRGGTMPEDPPATFWRTLAHVAHSLGKDAVPYVRVAWTKELFATLPSFRHVVLEVEESVGRGFVFVLAYDPQTELVLVRDTESFGATWTTVAALGHRSSLTGRSALVVPREGTTWTRPVGEDGRPSPHDRALDKLDASEIDADGNRPPASVSERLTDEILEDLPDNVPALHQRGVKLSNGNDLAAFLRWYATTRERFPGAEWPVQTYAMNLAGRRAFGEASIAWLEACERDPGDFRNHAGLARSLYDLGRRADADVSIRKAAALVPDSPSHVYWQAAIALSTGDDARVEVCSRIALPNETDSNWPESFLANLCERRGDLDAGLELLRAGYAKEPTDVWAAVRVARHLVRRGEFSAACELVNGAVEGDAISANDVGDVAAIGVEFVGSADGPQVALDRAVDVMKRHGVSRAVAGAAVDFLPFVPRAPALDALVPLLASTKDGSFMWPCMRLLVRSNDPGALFSAKDAFVRHGMPELTSNWILARALQRVGDDAAARPILEKVYEEAPGFEALRVYFACIVCDEDPARACTILEGQCPTYAAFQWSVLARALEKQGRGDHAKEFRSRLLELGTEALETSANWAIYGRFFDVAEEILAAASARGVAPSTAAEKARLDVARGDRDAMRTSAVALTNAKATTASDRLLAMECALQAHAWDEAVASVDAYLAALYDSRTYAYRWMARAARAGILAARGDLSERDLVLDVAKNDAAAIFTLARVEKELGASLAQDSNARLLALAGASAPALLRKEVFPWLMA